MGLIEVNAQLAGNTESFLTAWWQIKDRLCFYDFEYSSHGLPIIEDNICWARLSASWIIILAVVFSVQESVIVLLARVL